MPLQGFCLHFKVKGQDMIMLTFDELYKRLVKASVTGDLKNELNNLDDYDPHHLDCLLNPKDYSPVLRIGDCACSQEGHKCSVTCLFDAMYRDERGNLSIDPEACTGCGDCVEQCRAKKLTESKDILPTLEAIHNAKAPVYAMIVPAFINQFSEDVTPGKLRTAFK